MKEVRILMMYNIRINKRISRMQFARFIRVMLRRYLQYWLIRHLKHSENAFGDIERGLKNERSTILGSWPSIKNTIIVYNIFMRERSNMDTLKMKYQASWINIIIVSQTCCNSDYFPFIVSVIWRFVNYEQPSWLRQIYRTPDDKGSN